jgi:Rod binding domain-containing protein
MAASAIPPIDVEAIRLSRQMRAPAFNPTSAKDLAALRKTAEDFEAQFISQMLGHMFSGIKTDSLFGGGHGEDMYRSLLVDEYGKAVAKRGGYGIADSIVRHFLSLQEAPEGATS